MNKELGKVKVHKSADHDNKIIKALENAGFILVLGYETTLENYYTVAESEDKEGDNE